MNILLHLVVMLSFIIKESGENAYKNSMAKIKCNTG